MELMIHKIAPIWTWFSGPITLVSTFMDQPSCTTTQMARRNGRRGHRDFSAPLLISSRHFQTLPILCSSQHAKLSIHATMTSIHSKLTSRASCGPRHLWRRSQNPPSLLFSRSLPRQLLNLVQGVMMESLVANIGITEAMTGDMA
jgi:hypothetical protein